MKRVLYMLSFLVAVVLVILLVPGFSKMPEAIMAVIPNEINHTAIIDVLPANVPPPNSLKNMFGVNAYEWNFLQNPNNVNDPSHIYEPKMELIQSFGAVRHYLDWEKIESKEGSFTFNPANNGSWNYDAIYERCKLQNIEVLVCLKNCPDWIVKTYPQNMQNAEDVPAPYGLDRSDPATYVQQARAGFQLAARYGRNKNVNRALVTVNNKPRWTADPVNQVKTGMGLIKYIECDNERDKWWKGKQAHQSAAEYAANLSAFYDGNKGKLGKNAGVKNADPSMQVVMCGLAAPDPKYLREMVAWCKQHRGLKADGSIDLCFDVINYHIYPNDNKQHFNKEATRGVAPELTEAGQVADAFVSIANSLPKHPEVWVTETGYDINSQSPQRAIAIKGKSTLETQGDWILRTALLFNRHGIKRNFFYQLFDDNQSSTQYATSGLTDEKKLSRRPAADYILQTRKLMGNYVYKNTISNDPLVDVYQLGAKKMYVVVVPDEKGRMAHYKLNLGTAKTALVHSLKIGADKMEATPEQTVNGFFDIYASETPIFVEGVL